MKNHYLKIKPIHYERLLSGEKKCEIRLNDRDFQKGDSLSLNILNEPNENTDFFGHEVFKITHVLQFPDGLKDGYVALSLKPKNIKEDDNCKENCAL